MSTTLSSAADTDDASLPRVVVLDGEQQASAASAASQDSERIPQTLAAPEEGTPSASTVARIQEQIRESHSAEDHAALLRKRW
jgi:hypothetical protein